MRVNFGMQEVNYFTSGIGVYENKLITELMQYKDLKCIGSVFYARGIRKGGYGRFSFPVKMLYFPSKLAFDYKRKVFPIYLHQLCFRKSNVNLFFSYRLPKVKLDGKVICTIHDLIPLKTEMENEWVKNTYISYVSDAVKRSDVILTVSENSKKDIMEYFSIPESKIHIVPNGVEYKDFNTRLSNETLNKVREKYGLPEYFILYFGSTRKHKSVDSIIKAYAEMDRSIIERVQLVVTNGNDELKQIAQQMGVSKYVKFIGMVEDQDKIAFYQLAELEMLVSLYEGFGIPVIEAMAAGTPVITSNISSLPEVGGDAAILVDPLDIHQISASMEKVLTDDKLREDMIQKGYANAKKFTWENSAKKLHDIILEL